MSTTLLTLHELRLLIAEDESFATDAQHIDFEDRNCCEGCQTIVHSDETIDSSAGFTAETLGNGTIEMG